MNRRSTLWLVALACFGPVLLAYGLYYGPWGRAWLPQLAGSRVLLERVVQLPQSWSSANTERRWTLLYARATPCEQSCLDELRRIQSVHVALNRSQDRVQRAMLQAGPAPDGVDPALVSHSMDEVDAAEFAMALGIDAAAGGQIFVADPEGRVILRYPGDVMQKELLRDLKRLLSASGEGS